MDHNTKKQDEPGDQAQGISNRESPQEEAAERARYPPQPESGTEDLAEDRVEDLAEASPNRQMSQKAGTRSSGQKEDTTRHADSPAPTTRKVPGAFGREG